MALVESDHERRDAVAWNELVRRFAPYVHAVAVHAYRLPERDAEETFHTVFARTWEELDDVRSDDDVRARIVGLTLELARAAAERLGHADQPPPAVLDRLDDALALREAIRRLPPAQRDIATRFWLEREDEEVIGAAVGLPREVVGGHLRRTRRRLARELRPQGGPGVPRVREMLSLAPRARAPTHQKREDPCDAGTTG